MMSFNPEASESELPALEELTLHEMDGDAPSSPILSDHSSIHSSSDHSETSTLEYDQEPFHLFTLRIEKLCQTLWPPQEFIGPFLINSSIAEFMRANKLLSFFAPSCEKPLIERLRGGDNNRIAGITLPSSKWGEHGRRDLVLRVPRWGQGQTKRVVATLDYLRRSSSIPIADVVANDFSNNNPLGSPYVVQNRIPGSDLEILWDELNHTQRCTIARKVGRVMKNLLALESPMTGYITAFVNGTHTSGAHTVVPFDLESADGNLCEEPEQQHPSAVVVPRELESTLDFFRSRIGRWRAVDVARDPPTIDEMVGLWDGMLKVVEGMDDLGLFESKSHCLAHGDFYPRNIMAKIQPDGCVQVTGILDWDEAIVAPKFVNCEPPGWLWGFDDDHVPHTDLPAWPYEIPGANDVPKTSEQQELKRIFEESAGAEYVSMAYDEHFRLCRGLFRVALFGLTSNENYEAAERIIGDWARLRQEMVK